MDKLDLWKKAANLRKQLGEDATSPIDVFSLAHSIERLSMVFYPMGDHLSGMCIKSDNNAVIAINSSMSVGRQRFSMAHELFHLYYDDAQLTAICAKKIGTGKDKENQADQFASYLLMPPDALTTMIKRVKKNETDRLSVKDVVRLEQHFGVSRQAILFRLIEENEITQQEAGPMKQGVIWSAVSLGYDDTLYKPLPTEKQYMTYGFYIQQADEAFGKGLISSGKYEELLLSAYRSDLVYGDEPEGGELID
jgi:Zn-dependent peptidase ImmA (M78 family)